MGVSRARGQTLNLSRQRSIMSYANIESIISLLYLIIVIYWIFLKKDSLANHKVVIFPLYIVIHELIYSQCTIIICHKLVLTCSPKCNWLSQSEIIEANV